RGVRSSVRKLGQGAVAGARVQRVATGTRHFERERAGLGMSPWTLRIAGNIDLSEVVEIRRRNAFLLMAQLREVAEPLLTQLPPGACPLFFPLVVEDKPAVLRGLRAAGIEAIDFWRDFHPACPATEFPDVARLRRSVVEIPCHQDLSTERMQQIAAITRRVVHAAGTRRAHG